MSYDNDTLFKIHVDFCAQCGAEHSYMSGYPCSKCGSKTFTKVNHKQRAKQIAKATRKNERQYRLRKQADKVRGIEANRRGKILKVGSWGIFQSGDTWLLANYNHLALGYTTRFRNYKSLYAARQAAKNLSRD